MSYEKFEFPEIYNFPPLFTIQTNEETKRQQLEIWSDLIHNYCKSERIYVISTAQSNLPIFSNVKIKRWLSPDSLTVILDYLSSKGRGEWTDKKKEKCYIYWHRPEIWGKLIYDWAGANGLLNTVETFFELLNAQDAEWKGMDNDFLIHCLKCLEKEGKAEIIGSDGVKFF